jgi:hypothetical protein
LKFKGVFACAAEVAISVNVVSRGSRSGTCLESRGNRTGWRPASADDSKRLFDFPGWGRSAACAQLLRHHCQKHPTMRANLANCPLERLPTPGSFWAVALLAIASAALPWNARANLVTSGTSITVDSNVPNPWTSAIGSGPSTATGTTVDLLPNAQVVVGNASAISLADNANITVAGGALIQNHAVSTPGPYGDGGDTVTVHTIARSRSTPAAKFSPLARRTPPRRSTPKAPAISSPITGLSALHTRRPSGSRTPPAATRLLTRRAA